jgi:thiamine biosynthesis lipoprotein
MGIMAPTEPREEVRLSMPAGLGRRSFHAMGTTVTVIAPEGAAGVAAARTADLFETWEACLSRFRPDSELARLNASGGRETAVGPLLLDVVETALRAARATDGLFDPTLLRPLVAAGYDRTFEDVPADGPDDAADPGFTGGWHQVGVDRHRGTMTLPVGAGIDVGGIAKGMAVDAAVADLAASGISPVAVDAGGDLAVRGLPPGLRTWPIRVELPEGRHRVVAIASGALATSSVGRRRWTRGGQERNHLIDPRTAMPVASDGWSATVAADTCARAEVAAKVALLLGSDAAGAFLVRHGLTGLFVRRDGTQLAMGTWIDLGEPAA